jgi:hypothetical protein
MLPKSFAGSFRLLLISAPALFIGILVFKNGVDFPVLDEWDGTAPLFEKLGDGTLGFADFFAQHNEHRIFFPRLIFFGLGRLTHWNVRVELWVTWFLALVCLFNIWQIARRTNRHHTFWPLLAASVLLFSPLGVANFLWGFQVGFLLPLACITAGIWAAAYLRHPFNFVVAMLLCTICTFSIASGFASWLLTAPLLLFAQAQSKVSRKWWVIWVSLFSLEVLAYFWGYEKPPNHPPLWWFLFHPLTAAEYVLLFFGGPFTYGTTLPSLPVGLVMGALLLLILLIAGSYIWNKRSDRGLLGDTLPWLMLAMITVTSAVLIMIGRVGFGPGQARASRYLQFAVMLPIAPVALTPLLYKHWASSISTSARWATKGALVAALVLFTFFTCSGFLAGLPLWPMNRQLHSYGKTLVSFINVAPTTDELAKSVFPVPDRVKTAANALNRIGYWRPPLIQSNLIGDIANAQDGGNAAVGAFRFSEEEPGWIKADGSAFLTNERRPADAVLITYDNSGGKGKPQICAIARVGNPHQVVALRAVFDFSALPSTWECRFPRNRLPEGQRCLLEAWAFDVENCRAYRLPGNADFVW